MKALVTVRDYFMAELNAGRFDQARWKALADYAGRNGFTAIQAQLLNYITHYGKNKTRRIV